MGAGADWEGDTCGCAFQFVRLLMNSLRLLILVIRTVLLATVASSVLLFTVAMSWGFLLHIRGVLSKKKDEEKLLIMHTHMPVVK